MYSKMYLLKSISLLFTFLYFSSCVIAKPSLETNPNPPKKCEPYLSKVEVEKELVGLYTCDEQNKSLVVRVYDLKDNIILLSNPLINAETKEFKLDISWFLIGEYKLKISNDKEDFIFKISKIAEMKKSE